MIHDNAYVNAKGRVKLELINDQGEVVFTKEKKNLVVLTANQIVGEVMSDPNRTVRATQVDKGKSEVTAGGNGLFAFNLSKQREAYGVYEIDLGSGNTNKDISLSGINNLTELVKVTVAGTELALDDAVFVKDADDATLTFDAAPTGVLKVEYRKLVNPYIEMLPGSEKVKVGGVDFKHAATPSDADKKYSVDYKTGKVFFETAKTDVEVSYGFKVRFGLGFMGVAGKPAGHPDFKPVEFASTDKMKVKMENEFAGARQLVQYPALVTQGEPEIEIITTKPVATKVVTESLTATTASEYTLSTLGGKKLLEIVSVKDITDSANPADVTGVTIKDAVAGKVEFAAAPTSGNLYEVKVKVQENNDHLNFYLSEAPVLELIAVRHEDINKNVVAYDIQDKGMTVGKGDVYILNPNKGLVQFSNNPSNGVHAETPGQITLEYRINSGTTVQFVADFPKGTPGAILTPNTEALAMQAGQVTYTLQKAVAKGSDGKFIAEVFRNAVKLSEGTDYTLSADGKQVSFNATLQITDSISVKYSYLKGTHEIYQVAMFTEQTDTATSKMFNISGIGPVTKDENTGMRITWSVTF